jgi:hypothetical protein
MPIVFVVLCALLESFQLLAANQATYTRSFSSNIVIGKGCIPHLKKRGLALIPS